MRFYFPDSQDQIDPHFDFEVEEHPVGHMRQRDDHYAHEALGEPASTGVLVSLGVERYSIASRHRMQRRGVRDFYRLDDVTGPRIETLGDCGAFSYVKEDEPPYKTEEAFEFYEGCGFDAGVSIDHVIPGFVEEHDRSFEEFDPVDETWRKRQEITLAMADEFIRLHKKDKLSFQPVGAAQGWSPASFADCVSKLRKMGYQRVGLGGLVSLKTEQIIRVLEALDDVRGPDMEFHLFGVTRTEVVHEFQRYGVTSIDSTSPFRQAFKDDRDNYHTKDGNYVAIRIPQVDGNPSLKRAIKAGKIDQAKASKLERACLEVVRAYDNGKAGLEDAVELLREYEELYGSKKDHSAVYRRTLEEMPWKHCPCKICKDSGLEVVLFRGSERNKRRGFHNLWVFNQRLQKELSAKVVGVGN